MRCSKRIVSLSCSFALLSVAGCEEDPAPVEPELRLTCEMERSVALFGAEGCEEPPVRPPPPYEDPDPLEEGNSPRGVDRGTMITEPGEMKLEDWLKKHGFME